jgi:hypothetical protein
VRSFFAHVFVASERRGESRKMFFLLDLFAPGVTILQRIDGVPPSMM